jgi:hypothetical protein
MTSNWGSVGFGIKITSAKSAVTKMTPNTNAKITPIFASITLDASTFKLYTEIVSAGRLKAKLVSYLGAE